MEKRYPVTLVRLLLLTLSLFGMILACNLGGLIPDEEATNTPAVVTSPVAEVEETPAAPPVQTPTIPLPPTPEGETTEATPTPIVEVDSRPRPVFARFNEPAVDVVPAMYHEPVAPDLGNVSVPFVLSEAQLAQLAKNGFVVSPGQDKEFFTLYEKARYANVPAFITSDSLLHVYHLLFAKVLRTAEREHFIVLLRDLNQALLAQTDAQYQALVGTSWEDAARRSVAFIGVGSKLLDAEVEVPPYATDLLEAELALIEDAAGIMPSPIFPGLPAGEDYTQYIPRGHYTLGEDLTAYFKSMMWYGRMPFRLKTRDPEVGRAETRMALLLVQALRTAEVRGGPALDAWLDLYNPTVFFVGRSDDLTAFQYLDVIEAVYGPEVTLAGLADDGQLELFIEQANQLPAPKILGMVIYDTDDEEETTKGFRFMGQRFVPDAFIFRQLIYRNVGTRENRRGFPKGLDIMAAMGSERAYEILTEMGEHQYRNYTEQMTKIRDWVASIGTEEWTETLYNTWLYTFEPLLEEPGDGYPQFMQSEGWLDKQLNTSLGSWAELKHDTILYAKQVYAELGGGGSNAPLPKEARGYVEPVPGFYARLLALTRMTYEGLESRGLLSEQDQNSLQRLEDVVLALQRMAEKQLRGEPLTEEEHRFIRFFGGELEHLTMAAADVEAGEEGGAPTLDEDPQAAVIADVATDPDPEGDGIPNPMVLEEAVGRINEIYVVAPMVDDDGTVYLQIAKGGVFSYYEFPWPADDRLTDEKWRQMLDDGTAPPLPEWTASFFTPETLFADFQRVIYNFQLNLVDGYWTLAIDLLRAGEEVKSQFGTAFDELLAADQYVGRQWIGANYRSFDIQSDDLVVITVRETWQDTRYAVTGEFRSDDDEVVGQRGPYALDVTYTLERDGDGWLVTRVVYANDPPAWE